MNPKPAWIVMPALLMAACEALALDTELGAPPYVAAVAARFPAPAVRYETPALRPGRSEFTSNAELAAALRGVATRAGANAKLLPVGRSQAGVPIEALLFARGGDTGTRPTVMLVGQQHGDEPAPSEAMLVIAQELAGGALAPLLERINVLVLPRANVDGAAAAQRVTASGVDANRDHLLLRTSEAQAMAQLVREYRPVVVVDAHEYTVGGRYLEKFNAVQRFDLMFQYAMTANLPPALTRASEEWFRQPLFAAIAGEGLSAEWYYTTSTDPEDKRVSMGGAQVDTGRNVNGLKNAVSILLETRGVGIGRWHLLRRIHTHVVAQRNILESAARHADALLALRREIEAEISAQACRGEAVVMAGQTPTQRELLFIDPATGADKPVTVDWNSSLELRVLRARARPCGYWLAADATDAVQRLRSLGLTVQRFDAPAELQAEAWRETARGESPRPDVRGSAADAGATIVNVAVALEPKRLGAPAGSYYVPLDQPLANLAIAALEPDTQNSYFANRLLPALDRAARVMARPEATLTRRERE
jgi:hypothetical protein